MVQAASHLERLNHRTRRRMDLSQGNYDGLDEARTYYYSAGWQMLEEHVDTDLDDDTDRIGQQFWGVRYIDDAVARRVDRDGDGDFADDAAGYYYLTDVMFSVVGVEAALNQRKNRDTQAGDQCWGSFSSGDRLICLSERVY